MNNYRLVSEIVNDFFRKSGAKVADKVDREILGIGGIDHAPGGSITKGTLVAVKDGKIVSASEVERAAHDRKWRTFMGTANTQKNVFHREYQNAPYIDPTRQVDITAGDQAQRISSALEAGVISARTAGELMGINWDDEYEKLQEEQRKATRAGVSVDPAELSDMRKVVDALWQRSQEEKRRIAEREARRRKRDRIRAEQGRKAYKRIEYAIERRMEAGGSCWFCKQDLVRYLKVDDKTAAALLRRAKAAGHITKHGNWWCEASSLVFRQRMEGYLAHKHGLQESLPNNHPYKAAAPASVTMHAGAPSNPRAGDMWLENAMMKFYDGTSIYGAALTP